MRKFPLLLFLPFPPPPPFFTSPFVPLYFRHHRHRHLYLSICCSLSPPFYLSNTDFFHFLPFLKFKTWTDSFISISSTTTTTTTTSYHVYTYIHHFSFLSSFHPLPPHQPLFHIIPVLTSSSNILIYHQVLELYNLFL